MILTPVGVELAINEPSTYSGKNLYGHLPNQNFSQFVRKQPGVPGTEIYIDDSATKIQ